MNSSVFMGLVNNAALLLALGLLYDYFLRYLPRKSPPVLQKIVTGILLGLIDQPVMDRVHPDFHETIQKRIKRLNEDRKPGRRCGP